MVLRADRLGSVLDDGQAVCMRDSRVGFHLGWQPEEVDRHDRPGSTGNGRFQLLRVQVVGFKINIDKYGLCLEASNAPSSGNEGKWRGDNLVARVDACRHQSKTQRV